MIVEFYGLPGSGKTTLAKGLANKYPQRFVYLHTSPRVEIIKYSFLFFFSRPFIFFFWIKELLFECFRENFKKLFRYRLHLLLISIVQYQKAKEISSTALIDEGLYQRILAIYDRELNEKEINQCFSHIPEVNLLAICEHPETEFYRYEKTSFKEESPRIRLGKEYFEKWKETIRKNYNLVIRKIEEKGIKYVRVRDLRELEQYFNL